jgi:hypothetical protein
MVFGPSAEHGQNVGGDVSSTNHQGMESARAALGELSVDRSDLVNDGVALLEEGTDG